MNKYCRTIHREPTVVRVLLVARNRKSTQKSQDGLNEKSDFFICITEKVSLASNIGLSEVSNNEAKSQSVKLSLAASLSLFPSLSLPFP